jgi:hypothetical protein
VRQGEHRPDIDVLVIGNPDRDDLDDAIDRASRRIGREVNATVGRKHGGVPEKTASALRSGGDR